MAVGVGKLIIDGITTGGRFSSDFARLFKGGKNVTETIARLKKNQELLSVASKGEDIGEWASKNGGDLDKYAKALLGEPSFKKALTEDLIHANNRGLIADLKTAFRYANGKPLTPEDFQAAFAKRNVPLNSALGKKLEDAVAKRNARLTGEAPKPTAKAAADTPEPSAAADGSAKPRGFLRGSPSRLGMAGAALAIPVASLSYRATDEHFHGAPTHFITEIVKSGIVAVAKKITDEEQKKEFIAKSIDALGSVKEAVGRSPVDREFVEQIVGSILEKGGTIEDGKRGAIEVQLTKDALVLATKTGLRTAIADQLYPKESQEFRNEYIAEGFLYDVARGCDCPSLKDHPVKEQSVIDYIKEHPKKLRQVVRLHPKLVDGLIAIDSELGVALEQLNEEEPDISEEEQKKFDEQQEEINALKQQFKEGATETADKAAKVTGDAADKAKETAGDVAEAAKGSFLDKMMNNLFAPFIKIIEAIVTKWIKPVIASLTMTVGSMFGITSDAKAENADIGAAPSPAPAHVQRVSAPKQKSTGFTTAPSADEFNEKATEPAQDAEMKPEPSKNKAPETQNLDEDGNIDLNSGHWVNQPPPGTTTNSPGLTKEKEDNDPSLDNA